MSWLSRSHPLALMGLLGLFVPVSHEAVVRIQRRMATVRPRPDVAELRYGPFDRNVMDVWTPPSEKLGGRPAPVVIFFHGGGFLGGDKSSVPAWLVRRCLAEGIAVASANYRLSRQSPYPGPMLDGARAVQFLRHKAEALGIDPDRIAACGNSAGAGIALWVGFQGDMADPSDPDPVGRESTRLVCIGGVGAQTSYDPRFIKRWIGGRAHEHAAIRPFFGLKSDADLDGPSCGSLFEDASPLHHVSVDDPPVFLYYSEPKGPLPSDARPGEGIHHPNFGIALKERLDPLQIECILRHEDDYRDTPNPEDGMPRDFVAFFQRHLLK
ncbi:MAG: alpha/beta hydrolase [Paludisphaera borealis]|uniref:alpha/beta hydrolase n=1 Tax=Paludisphaera borealis TaxID=1387353 RepID=UPI00283F778D|nr:alpha/beta hydrolase [Paludisphaera borealis]MDR3619920.1 alpha/beta hydrolase [Paludisphaera borealis]